MPQHICNDERSLIISRLVTVAKLALTEIDRKAYVAGCVDDGISPELRRLGNIAGQLRLAIMTAEWRSHLEDNLTPISSQLPRSTAMDMKPKPATETSREKAYRRLQDVLDMCDLTNGNSDNALCVQQAMDNLRLINFSSASIQAIQVLVENLIYRFIGHKLNNSVAQAYKDCRSRLRDIDDNKPG